MLLIDYVLFKIGSASHLKLQKLLYYIQGYHLGYFDKEIISDDFEAWLHGPVSRKLYDGLKDKSILYSELEYRKVDGEEDISDVVKSRLNDDQLSLVDQVLDMLGGFSGIELEEFTHSEPPWIEARQGLSPGDRCENIISKDSIKAFFKTRVHA